MASIIIAHQSPIIHEGIYVVPAFYEALVNSLIENGNNVLHLVTNDFLTHPWNGTNKIYSDAIRLDLIKTIQGFSPDLLITFNNSSIENIENLVDCPIIIWDADTPIYFNDKDAIKANIDRYHLFAASEQSAQEYRTAFGARDNQIHKMRFATAIKAHDDEKRYNISFIGSNFKPPTVMRDLCRKSPTLAREILFYARTHSAQDVQNLLKDRGLDSMGIGAGHIANTSAGQERIQTLATVAPLGLGLFGDMSWNKIYDRSIDLFLSFDPSLVYSVAHNEAVYNRSKIGISISHSQNLTAYPWRISDIMASNAVLVADKKLDLIRDFGDDVPLQLYETPLEAYDLCVRLLDDDALRADITAASQAAIDKGYRWHHRLQDIAQITGVAVLGNTAHGRYMRYTNKSHIVAHIVKQASRSKTVQEVAVSNATPKNRGIRKSLTGFLSSPLTSLRKLVPDHAKYYLLRALYARHNRNLYR